MAEPDQAEDQGHRYADQQDTEQAAHGLVLEVFEDELAGHFFFTLPLVAGAGGWAAGGRLADHLQRGSFGLLEHEFLRA